MNTQLLTMCRFFAIIIFTNVWIAPQAFGNDDWAKYYIGAYSLERMGVPVDIAVWQQRSSLDDLHKYPKMVFTGVIAAKDGSCRFHFQDVYSFPRYWQFNAELDLQLMGKVEAFGIFTSGFDDMISDEQYMGYKPPIRHLRNGQPNPAFREYRIQLEAKQNQCRKTVGKGFHLFQDEIGGKVFFGDRGRAGIPENIRPISRVKISSELLSVLKSLSQKRIVDKGYDTIWPNEDAFNALQNPSYLPSMEGALSDKCMQRSIASQYSLFLQGTFRLYSRIVDEKSVLVTEHKIPTKPLKSGEQAPEKHTLYKRDNSVNWQDMLYTTPERASAKAHCDSANATFQYLNAIKNNTLERLPLPNELANEAFDIDQAFILSQNGIVFVNPEKLGNGTVVTSRSPHFKEGDLFYFIEKAPGFRLGLRAWLKNPLNDKYEIGYDMPVEHAALSKDTALSEQFKTEVLSGELNIFSEPMCSVYAGVNKPEECIEFVPVKNRLEQVYVLKTSRAQAISIFNKLFPDFVEPSAPDCSTLPFCNKNSNIRQEYLNAVYTKDVKTIKALEKVIMASSIKAYESMFSSALNEDQEVHVTIIPFLLNEYIYAYQNKPAQCFQPGSHAMKFEDYVPETSLVDGLGNKVWSAGGYARETTYKMVDADFIEVCTEVCGIREADMFGEFIGSFFNGNEASKIKGRMLDFMQTYDCQSPEVQQFEESLLFIHELLSVPASQTNRFYRGYF